MSHTMNYIMCLIESFFLYFSMSCLFECKFQKYKKLLVIATAIIIQAAAVFLYTPLPLAVKNGIYYIISFFIVFLIFKGKFFIKSLFIILVCYQYLISEIILANIFTYIINSNIEKLLSSGTPVIVFAIFVKLINLVLALITIAYYKKINFNIPRKYWITINIIMAVILIITQSFAMINPSIQENNKTSLLIFIISMCFFVMTTLVNYFFGEICIFYQKEKTNYILSLKSDALEQQLVYQDATSTDMKKFKHDINKNMTNILYLLRQNNIIEAKSYIEEITSLLEDTTNVVNSGNVIIDAIVNYKIAICKGLNIKYQFEIDNIPTLKINSTDLSAMISNLLDNAIEANGKLDEANRNILFKIFCYKNYLSIVVKNPHANEIEYTDGFIKSNKLDFLNHGYGLKLIKASVEKYFGTFSFSNKENSFTATVMLPIMIE